VYRVILQNAFSELENLLSKDAECLVQRVLGILWTKRSASFESIIAQLASEGSNNTLHYDLTWVPWSVVLAGSDLLWEHRRREGAVQGDGEAGDEDQRDGGDEPKTGIYSHSKHQVITQSTLHHIHTVSSHAYYWYWYMVPQTTHITVLDADLLSSPVYTIQPVVKHCQIGCTTRFDNRLNEQLFVQHGCQTRLTTGLTTGWMFVYTIQPAVNPVVQLVWQPVVSCKRGFRIHWALTTFVRFSRESVAWSHR